MRDSSFKHYLLASTVIMGAALGLASPALAQDAANEADTEASEAASVADAPEDVTEEIVVTGSLFRRTNEETASPVTVLTSETLEQRGLTNVADAVRSIAADSSGSIPTAFTGGFGQGSAAVSLRGLSVNSTLTIIDGLRTVTYPLADDGQRAFVDLNTIPRVAIDRIEVLKDGASSTYGADAIGGVVNILMRKQFTGVNATAEAGVTDRGDGQSYRGSILAGFGDIGDKGWNFYAGAEYERTGDILARDRGFPYDTADLSSIGGDNNNSISGFLGTAEPAVVLRADQLDPNNPFSGAATGDHFDLLNPAECTRLGGSIFDDGDGSTSCEQNLVGKYGQIQPDQTRWGVTARGSMRLGDSAEAYLMGSFYRNEVSSIAFPSSIRNTNPISTLNVVLPVYVCAAGTNCATATDRQLNPNNPYAADGDAAILRYRFSDIPATRGTESQVMRAAAGVEGETGGWSYRADLSAVRSDLDVMSGGLINIAGLTRALNTGSYNFRNPLLNSDEVRRQIAPDVLTKARSELYLAQAFATRDLMDLPGGPLQFGAGGQVRREILDQPNQNANQQTLGLNQYSASGKRTVWAGFAELNAPIIDDVELSLSGRYDNYSTGFDSFSPRAGIKFTPVPELALRGTYSQGFRAPSFAESTQGSVVGYTSTNPGDAFAALCTSHGGTFDEDVGCTGGTGYVGLQSIGFNNASNPDLGPERSRNFTLGAVFQPARWISFTVDYYNIVKKDVITGGPLSNLAISNYYNGLALPDGYTVTLNAADPLFPNAMRTIAQVNAPYENASELATDGIDISMLLQFRTEDGVRLSSQLDATRILHSSFIAAEGQERQQYVGTQGPFIISSGAGTPAWRANWSNSVEAGPMTVTGTFYYTSGYRSVAEDQNGVGATTCADALYSPAFCETDDYIQFDLVGSYKVNDNFTFYANVINLFDADAPINPANYAANNYNPTWSQGGAVGRMFRFGANMKF